MSGVRDSVFPAVPRDSFFGTFNLRSLGMSLAIAWFAAMLWSPAVVPPIYREHDLDMQMHVLRLSMLIALCVAYAIARMHPSGLFDGRFGRWFAVVCFVVAPLPLIGSLCSDGPAASFFASPAVAVPLWAVGGLSASAIMLVWGYQMDTRGAYGQGVVNVAAGATFSGVLLLLLSFLRFPVSVLLVMGLPYAMLALWLACSKTRGGNRSSVRAACREGSLCVRTGVRTALGGQAPSFVFSYGFVMGVAGSVGTRFSLDAYFPFYAGAASVLAGVGVLYLARTGRLKVSGRLFVLFLPFAVICMFLFSIAGDSAKVALLFLVFLVVNVCNVFNTAYVDGEELGDAGWQSLPPGGFDQFAGESRTADMIGSALGWGLGTAIQFFIDGRWAPQCYFLIAVVLVGVASVVHLLKGDGGMSRSDVRPSFDSLVGEWEAGCARLGRVHGLSAREQEIFLLLSRGRDRQYIHERLGISPNTVRTHAYNLYRKLGVHDQQQLIDLVEAELSGED